MTYSDTTAATLEKRIGTADYSYFFILRGYQASLERLGRVIAVENPAEEVDQIFLDNPEEPCVFLCFTPPHRQITGLKCPTVCVFAWEFSTIPCESWRDTPEYNWAKMLETVGNGVTICQYAADVVHEALGDRINLAVVPAAVDVIDNTPLMAPIEPTVMPVKATLYDSAFYNLTTDMVNDEVNSTRNPLEMDPWDGERIELVFSQENSDAIKLLIGFYSPEEWGSWSRTKSPWIMLPNVVHGPVTVGLELVGYGTNIGREITISLGGHERSITAGELPELFELEFDLPEGADILKFSNLDLTHAPGARDHRSLGLGIKGMTIKRPANYGARPIEEALALAERARAFILSKFGAHEVPGLNELTLKGVVYTTVMNPQDGRKNWEDLVRAFCWAFREEENATLVLKMTHHNLATFLGKLLLLYSQMAPFKCRVVAVHGFLSDKQYETLIGRTHYVVNSSHCEGQCLPVMEFMGQGIPAVAPNHTAMADYVNDRNAFVVKSSLYPTFWPIDDRKAIRTLCYRIDWESLKDAFLDSYNVAVDFPKRYKEMSGSAIESVRRVASEDVVYEKLEEYLVKTAASYSDVSRADPVG